MPCSPESSEGLGNGGEERDNWSEAASAEATQAYDPVAFGDNR
jgi:hypothetical protein